ncbi:regulatory protein, luxR family [Pseudomonas asplenii]|uniref:Regulatory protein, luxR family n=2 Tax=Pseudomonas asplenii TaxID=53407 RepID=A0A1H1XIW4_9PSED|nr:regulatory protein, luxR family [Pseudomonas asplenii]
MGEIMNVQQLFPHIGKVIASTGSSSFPRLLHDLILTRLPVDATHITQVCAEQGESMTSNATSIGNVGMNNDCIQSLTKTSTQSIWLTDNLLAENNTNQHLTSFATCLLPPSQPNKLPEGNAAELHLSSSKAQYRYIISLYRSNPSQHFSTQERSTLQNLSHLLLPLVEKHINTIRKPTRQREGSALDFTEQPNRGMENLRKRFDQRLSASGLKLSSRETEICVGLLAGLTGPELAQHLELGVNTVESYLKRAAIKMGISGRHSLIRWMHTSHESQVEPNLKSASRRTGSLRYNYPH